VGSGSKLIQEIELGEGTLVGLGSVVLRGTEPGSTVVGNPARALARPAPGDGA
jgi:serine acetyltransferase